MVVAMLFFFSIFHLRLHDEVDGPVGEETDDAEDEVENDLRVVPDELQGPDGKEEDDKGNCVCPPTHSSIIPEFFKSLSIK